MRQAQLRFGGLGLSIALVLASCTNVDPTTIACSPEDQCPTGYVCGPAGTCTRANASTDAGMMDAGAPDAGATDAGLLDAGAMDAGEMDAGEMDAGEMDAGEMDAGETDGGAPDAGATDAGETDAGGGPVDAGASDAGGMDAGASDAGETDAGASDAGVLDAGASDAGPMDAGASDADAGAMDAGAMDAGAMDAGSFDAGSMAVLSISHQAANAATFSAVAGFNQITVTFDSSESLDVAPASLSVTLEAFAFTCGPWQSSSPSYTCTYTVTGSEVAGAQAIDIAGADGEGGQAAAFVSTFLDFTPPALAGSSAMPPAIRLGQTETIDLTPTEALSAAPTLVIPHSGSPVFTLSPGTTYSFTYTAVAGDATDAYETNVTMTDLVGNMATVSGPVFIIDEIVPTISSVATNAARFSAVSGFNDVVVTFNTAKALASTGASLVVTLGGAPMTCQAHSATQPNYTCAYTVTGTEGEGSKTISLTATDEAGNTSTASATVTFDFTPPSLTSSSATPVVIRLGQTETIALTPSEALSAAPTLATSLAGMLTFTLVPSTTYSYTHTATGGDGSGGYLTSVTMTDLVGNTAMVSGPSFSIDETVPTISGVMTNAARFSAVTGFNEVVVSFDTTKSLDPAGSSLVVKLGATPMRCQTYMAGQPNYSCTYTVLGTEGEGMKTISITATDEVGNTSSGSTTVTFDFTPPSLTSSSALLTVAGLGQTETIALVASEALSAAPTVTTSGAGMATFTLVPSTTYSFTHTASAGDASGTYQSSVSMTDLVGNAATVSGPSFALDVVVPTISSVMTNASLFSAVSGFNSVVVSFDTAKSLGSTGSSLIVTLAGSAMTCGSYSAGQPSYSCAYTVMGTEGEGSKTISITATDEAGNSSTASTVVTFDFTPPSLTSSSATPAAIRLGQTETIALTPSETLSAPPTLVSPSYPALVFTLSPGTTYSFTHTAVVADGTNSIATSVTMTDLVGNTATVTGPHFLIDQIVPTISSMATNHGTFSAVAGYSGVVATFNTAKSVSSAGSTLVVTIGGAAMTCQTYSATQPNYSCAYTVLGTEGGGSKTISVTATDEVGNTGTASTAVTFDFTPPSLTSSSASPAIAGVTETETLALTPSEALLQTPTVTTSGAGSLAFTLVGGTTYSMARVIQLSDASGAYTTTIGMTDLVGNAATVAGPSFSLDTVIPVVSSVATNASIFSAVANYNSIVLTFHVPKSLDTSGCSVSAKIGTTAMMCGSFSSGAVSYTCTYHVTGSETQGTQTISIATSDEVGQVGSATTTVKLDFTPPSLTSSSASPATAGVGNTETLVLTPSETLLQAPTVTTSGAPVFTLVASTTYSFTHLVTTSDASGAYSTFVEMTDVVGNATTVAGPSFTLDTVIPVVTNLSVNATTFSAVATYNSVVATFHVPKSLSTAGCSLVVTVGGAAMTCGAYSTGTGASYSCTYTVKGTETAGAQTISVAATDEAGNTGSATTTVTFDFTPPSLTVRSAQPAVAVPVDIETLTFTTSEALLSTPALTVSGAGTLAFSHTLTAGNAYTYTYTVKGTDTKGAYTTSIPLTDLVGNTATVTGPPFTISLLGDSTLKSTFTASPTSVAVGVGVTLTLTLKDGNGNALVGRAVTLTSTGLQGTFSSRSGVTGAGGVFSSTFTSNQPGLISLQATTSYQTYSTSVTILTPSCTQTTSFGTGLVTTVPANAVAVGDFNEDGLIDLIYATSTGMTFMSGLGTGYFGTAVSNTISGIGTASWVLPYDLNKDGHLDAAIFAGSTIYVLLGNGNGTFQAAVTSTATAASQMWAADFNNDGIPDLVTSSYNTSAHVLLGTGTGTFVDELALPSNHAHGIAVGDFNHDANLDIALNDNTTGKFTVIFGNGDGTFDPGLSYSSGGFEDTGIAAGDFNNDGWLDLVGVAAGSTTVGSMLNDETGKFVLKGDYSDNGSVAGNITVGDLNGDGELDAVTGLGFGGGVCVLLGNGDGSFATATHYYGAGGGNHLAYLADMNGDGRPDIVDVIGGTITVGLNACGP